MKELMLKALADAGITVNAEMTDDELMDQALIAPGWERMPSDHGRPVYHDGNELVRPLELAAS